MAEKREPPWWYWNGIKVQAWSKSEARAKLKAELKLDRLPVGAKVQKV